MATTTTFTADFAEGAPFRIAFIVYRARGVKNSWYAVVGADGAEVAQFDGSPEGHTDAYELACTLTTDAAEAQAEAERLLAELNQISGQWDASLAEGRDELALVLKGAYDSLSARIRALGYDIGPDGRGGLSLYDARTQLPLAQGRRAA